MAAFAALADAGGAAPPGGPEIEAAEIPSPAAAAARDPAVATAPDGTVWMAWWEPAGGGDRALRCTAFDAAGGVWGPARTIVAGPAANFNPEQPAAFAAGAAGELAAAWTAAAGPGPGLLLFSRSADGGRSWSSPVPLSQESDRLSRASLAWLADGTVLAVWADGRAPGPDGAARLYVRFATGPHAGAPDWLLAADASARGAPELIALLDGGALLAYRAKAAGGRTVPSLARLHGLHWQRSHPFAAGAGDAADGLADGPRLAADGGRIALVWSAGEPGQAAILASSSPDAGTRFLRPKSIDLGRPEGRPDAVLLHDGAVLAIWLEGGLQLRRLTPAFQVGPPVPLGPAAQAAQGFAHLAVARDYAGDVPTAEALVVFAGGPAAPGLHTLRVTIPEAALLAAADDDCHCAPTPGQLRGFSLRGTLIAAGPDGATLWEADAVPGVLDPGRHRFLAAPEVAARLRPGDTYLARIERRGSDWWVFEARRLDEP
jgi:hypothetical protein